MSFKEFTNKYQVQKTLRFKLCPIGETLKHIEEKGLLEEDEKLAKEYKKAKRIIDEYHKHHINEKLKNFNFKEKDLNNFAEKYRDLKGIKTGGAKQNFETCCTKIRKEVSKVLNKKSLFEKRFITEDLPNWLEENPVSLEGNECPRIVINNFKKRTTYFTGFNDNRKNIYTDQPHSTSVGYRLIHDNLPKFLDNIDRYKNAKEEGLDFSEIENNFDVKLDDLFRLESFNKYLTQKYIDCYNQILGGKSNDGNVKIQGINEKINLFSQQQEDQAIKKKIRSFQLEKLYKQILSDRNEMSFRFDEIENDAQLCKEMTSLYDRLEKSKVLINKVLKNLNEADHEKIYIRNDKSIEEISRNLFGYWGEVKDCLKYYAEKELYPTPEGRRETEERIKERARWVKKDCFSFTDIHEALRFYFNHRYSDDELKNEKESKDNDLSIQRKKEIAMNLPLLEHFSEKKIEVIITGIIEKYKNLQRIIKKYENINEENLRSKGDEVQKIKSYLDSLMEIHHFFKPLWFHSKEEKNTELYEKDSGFYEDFYKLYDELKQIVTIYNKSRNYLTKKPYSVKKYKLNFENQTLADGWDRNKEKDNSCIILFKEDQYFLGIINTAHKKIFEEELPSDGDCYQKMNLKFLPDPKKMLPKVFFAKRNTKKYAPSEEIQKIREHSSHTESGEPQEGFSKKEFNIQDMQTIIDFFKLSIQEHEDWSEFNFNFSDTTKYHKINDFYKEVENQGYSIKLKDISSEYIDKLVIEGGLYLFKIYSKDFSKHSRGRKNLQTLYWKELFTERNLKDVIYKLGGKAELFYRKASIEHSDEIWKHGHHRDDPGKKQKYPIIKDRRYAKNTFLFHVPITCNFQAESNANSFNDLVKNYISENTEIKIIGIDRGERHLAYYALINENGEILEQGSLNAPTDGKDYQNILDKREKERDEARKSWTTIEKIKDLKEGYLSQVVSRITRLMVEHNAVIVFEDLNWGFKRGRFKIEKQVYQKLEKAIISKLNYLVLKDRENDEPGGLLNALQLTARFESFSKLRKQTGFVFYVPASYTSKICPSTGFVDLLRPRYESIEKTRAFFQIFEKIFFNKKKGYFEFHFNYKNFPRIKEQNWPTWKACSHSTRLENFKDNGIWETREIDLTNEIKSLLKQNSISFYNEQCLIKRISEQSKSDFLKSFIRLFRLTIQMRNSKKETNEDWLISPIKDNNGFFFDSRDAGPSMPKDADANGAYHIALKGRLLIDQIKKDDKKSPDLSNACWFRYIQGLRNI